MSRLWLLPLPLLLSVSLAFVAPPSCGTLERFGDAEFQCVSAKQRAASRFSASAFRAYGTWLIHGNDAIRDAQLAGPTQSLHRAFDRAEGVSAVQGVDCVDQTASAAAMESEILASAAEITEAISDGASGSRRDRICQKRLVFEAGRRTQSILDAEAQHTAAVPNGGDRVARDEAQDDAAESFREKWDRLDCASGAGESEVSESLDALSDSLVFQTVVSPQLSGDGFEPVSPTGTVEYQGRTLEPRCGFDDDSDYHFFVRKGSVNKLVVYYQGGGACWENLTCGIPVCKDGADPVNDDPDLATTGFADLNNPENPFRDWNAVFITYCTCDVHFGDADQVYPGVLGDVAISHRGFENAKVVEKFAREHFLNPDEIFVTGSSAGAYGAVFHGPLLHEAWPASRFSILGDAGNGVITPSFLQNEFENWNFLANTPDDVPGVIESIESGEGMVAYIEAVADFFPDTNWAHYSTSYDGGTGGQTGFYNVMLNDNNPAAALSWWEGSCQFNDVMVDQAFETFDRAPDNYRYYIGTGSRHTMYGSDKVYDDQTGGEQQTIADWIVDMIDFVPGVSSSDEWQNVECLDCGIVLPGDPTPAAIPTDPFFDDGGQTVIVCEEPA